MRELFHHHMALMKDQHKNSERSADKIGIEENALATNKKNEPWIAKIDKKQCKLWKQLLRRVLNWHGQLNPPVKNYS